MWRRRSPSVMMPTSRPSSRPRRRSRARLLVISQDGVGEAGASARPAAGRRPCASAARRAAAGCRACRPDGTRRSRAAEKPRRSSSATASASPSASMQVVEVVGARPIGQASPTSGSSRHRSAASASVLARPADHGRSAGSRTAACRGSGRAARWSRRSWTAPARRPAAVIMPRSPWLASAGWT